MVLKRMIWAGLAFCPGAAMAAASSPEILSMSIGATGIASASACATLAVIAASRDAGKNGGKARARLLRKGALAKLKADLPAVDTQRATVADAMMAGAGVQPIVLHLNEPETADAAKAAIVRQAVASFGDGDLDDLPQDQLAELYLFVDLLTTTPGNAGRLAHYFRNPAEVLHLRDQLRQIAEDRARFEQQQITFQSARSFWRSAGKKGTGGLLNSLQSLRFADVDLWHYVVVKHDLTNPDQRAAADWCVMHPNCDQATLAVYIRRMLDSGAFEAAIETGDQDRLAMLRSVILRWISAGSSQQSLVLEASPDAESDMARLAALIERLPQDTDGPRWTLPTGAFGALPGRDAQPRDHWCLQTGRMRAAPRWHDYVGFDQPQAA